MNKASLIEHLRNHEGFSEEFKQKWISRIESEDVTVNLLNELQDAVQEFIDQTYESVGITDDENDPEYKAAYQTMVAEIDAAQAELELGMDSLVQDAKTIMNTTVQQMEQAQADDVRDSM